ARHRARDVPAIHSWLRHHPRVAAQVLAHGGRLDMPPVTVDPTNIKSFRTSDAFARWLGKQHAKTDELWLRIFKKASGVPSITYAEALDVALCWGWIDGIKK